MANPKSFFGISAAAVVACVTVACHPGLDLQGISAGFIKCPPSQVVVGNEETHGGLREWDALYQDEEWHCVRPVTVRTATPWVETECRRVWKDSAPLVLRENSNAVSFANTRTCAVPGIPAGAPCDSPSNHQTSE